MTFLRKRFRLAFGLIVAAAVVAILGGLSTFSHYEALNQRRLNATLELKALEDDLLSRLTLEVQYARSYMYAGNEEYILKYQLANQDASTAYQDLARAAAELDGLDPVPLERLALFQAEFNTTVAELIALRRGGDPGPAIAAFESRVDPLVEQLLAAMEQVHDGIETTIHEAAQADGLGMRRDALALMGLAVLGSAGGLVWITRTLTPMLDQLELLGGAMERSQASPLHEIVPAPALRGGGLTDLLETYNQLAARQAELRRRNLDFLEVLCHKMRSPLASVLGYSVLLADPKGPQAEDDRHRFVQTIIRQTEALAQLVDDVLRAARLDDDQSEMVFTPVRVETLLSDVVEESRQQRGRPITLEDGPGPVVVPSDALRLREVFVSLIENAAKGSPPDKPVTINLEKNEHKRQVEVVIRGFGNGQPREDRPASARPRTRDAHGIQTNGLAMYIASRIVQAHHGQIEFDSQPGAGAAYKISLPLGTSEDWNG